MRRAALILVFVALLGTPCIAGSKPTGKPENIVIAVDKDGNIYYNNLRIRDMNELRRRFMDALRLAIATHRPLPVVHIDSAKGGKVLPFKFKGNEACPDKFKRVRRG
jgi:hypothetical protein